MSGHVERKEAKRTAYRILVRKPEGKGPVARPTLGGKILVGSRLGKQNGVVFDWIHRGWDRGQWRVLVNTVMKLGVT
jgi:hypothetical protein